MFSYQLKKNNNGYANNYGKKDHSFKISRFLGDPFGLTTLSMCTVSFIVALVGSITAATDGESFPKFTWWGLSYQFIMMVLIFLLYCFDLVEHYKMFLTGGTAISFVYNTNSTTILIYADGSRKAAASAGCILLNIVNLIWIFYYGSDSGSPINKKIDSYSLNGVRPSNLLSEYVPDRRYSSLNRNSQQIKRNSYAHNYANRQSSFQQHPTQDQQTKSQSKTNPENNYMASTALNGFENIGNSNDSTPQFGNTLNNLNSNQQENDGSGNNTTKTSNNSEFVNPANARTAKSKSSITDSTASASMGLYSDMGEELSQFPYRARALYSYDADPSDAYEISFTEGEILSVADIEGRWWSCRKDNGERGIIPSNYVELIES